MASPLTSCILLWTATLLILAIHTASSTSPDIATYIVHMDRSAMPPAFSDHHGWYHATLASAANDDDPSLPQVVYAYDHAIDGFCARLSSLQLEQLKKLHGYLSSYRVDVPVRMHTTHTSDFLNLTPEAGLWPAGKYGEDVIIGVVDTGVWPESASYNDDGMTEVPSRWKGTCETGTGFSSSACNRKLIGARSFNNGFLASHPNETISLNSPRDIDGHGTHTSSTAGGSYVAEASFFGYGVGPARGMAPRARLAMYKVFWSKEEGKDGADLCDILAGIDRAISDGVNVLSLSLGNNHSPLYSEPIAIAAYRAMERDIFVATSSGNDGPFMGILSNGIPWVLTVGASTVDRKFAGVAVLGDGTSIVGQSLYAGSPPSLEEVPLVFMGLCNDTAALARVRQKIVVCDNQIFIKDAIDAVESARVEGGIFIANDSFQGFSRYVRFTFPGTIINPEDGPAILGYMNRSSDPRATLRFRETVLGVKPAPVVATYSSRGPSRSCPTILKPDLVAPGHLILASWAYNISVGNAGDHQLYSPYNIESGTSMSCPHAAGVAALLKAARPDWSPAAIRSAMMTTATPLDNILGPITDHGDSNKPATPLAMGSGHIQPNAALHPGLVYDATAEDYVRLLCAMNFTQEQIMTITRSLPLDCSDASLDLNYPSFIAFFDVNQTSGESAREFRRTVTNVGDAAAVTYTAKVVQPEGFWIRVEPETLVFREKLEKQSFTLRLEGQMPTGMDEDAVVQGSLSWVDDGGRYVVRSPIVATTFIVQPL